MSETRSLRVFLSYDHADIVPVRDLYNVLIREGFDVWFDEESLVPGQVRQLAIETAIRSSDAIIICLSQIAVNREGFVQKEYKFALDMALEKPEDRIFLIPLRLEECDLPNRLAHLQWVDIFNKNGYEKLIKALAVRNSQIESNISSNTIRVAEAFSKVKKDYKTNRGETSVTDKRLLIDKILQSGLFDIPEFTEKVIREKLILQLMELVKHASVVAVEGLSGSGKSYLVSSLLETKFDELGYKSILWYDPQIDDTLDNFVAQTEAIISLAGLSSLSKCKELLSLFRREKILLVIDNFEQVDQPSYSTLLDLAGRQGTPASVILISREYSELSRSLSGIKHFGVGGFDASELQQYLEIRGIRDIDETTISKILEETDGLPLAASLFATLVIDFGSNTEELLGGKIIKANRLHQWFNEILSKMEEDDVKLLQFLSHCDVPFNRGIINLASRQNNINNIDLCFEQIQRKYLVQRYTPYRWNVHRLISSFCQNNIKSDEKRKINLALAYYYERGITIDRKELIDFDKLNWLILSCKYYQKADKFGRSEHILRDISKTVKSRGLYQVFIQLSLAEIKGNPKRDSWIDYDYAHCCYITGRLRQAIDIISPLVYTDISNEWGKRLAVIRLYAEILGSTGQEQIALEKLREALESVSESTVHSTILNHAKSVEVWLLTKLMMYSEAEKLSQELLAESVKQGDYRGGAISLTRLGIINNLTSKQMLAKSQFEEASQLFRESGDRRGLAWSLLNLAETDLSLGLPTSCYEHLQESLRISTDIGQSSQDYLLQLETMYKKINDQKTLDLIELELQRVKFSFSEIYL
jgi:tetratricopeptide (TPR) repeat protein